MRIAQVAPGWLTVPPDGYGGIEWITKLLADGLVERGHEVTLFATGDSETKADLEFVLEEAPGPAYCNSIWHDTVHQLLVYRAHQDFDVIHQHACWSAMVGGLLSDRPVVHTVHGQFDEGMRTLYSMTADRIWFVAISESQRRGMPGLRYAGVVHNGIDLDDFPLRKEKEDFLLFLGRACPDKGPRRAVEAAALSGLPLVMVVKVEEPGEREHWKREVEPILPDSTTVLQGISHQEKVDLLGRARALLFPIDWEEPFGLVMTEAMAAGTPVIATPRGAVPEVVEHGTTGFVVPVADYAASAGEAIRRLGEIDPVACRARVEERFSKERMVEDYEAIYERLGRGGGAP